MCRGQTGSGGLGLGQTLRRSGGLSLCQTGSVFFLCVCVCQTWGLGLCQTGSGGLSLCQTGSGGLCVRLGV